MAHDITAAACIITTNGFQQKTKQGENFWGMVQNSDWEAADAYQ